MLMRKIIAATNTVIALMVIFYLCLQPCIRAAEVISESEKIEIYNKAIDWLGVQKENVEKSHASIEYMNTSSDSIIDLTSDRDSIEVIKVGLQNVEYVYEGKTYTRDYDMYFDYNTRQLIYIYSYSEEYGNPKFYESPGKLESKNYLIRICNYEFIEFPSTQPNLSCYQAMFECWGFPWQVCEIEAFYVKLNLFSSKEPINAWVIIMRGIDPPLEPFHFKSILVPSKNYIPPPEERNTFIQIINDETGRLIEAERPAPYKLGDDK